MAALNDIEEFLCVRSDAPGYRMPRHAHQHHAMLLIPVSGSLTVQDEFEDVERCLEPDNFYFIEGGASHSTYSNFTRQTHLAIYVNSDWLQFVFRNVGVPPIPKGTAAFWHLSDTANDIARILDRDAAKGRLHGEHRQKLASVLAESCLQIAASGSPTSLVHPVNHGRLLVLQAQNWLRSNLDQRLDVDRLAAELNISRRHLTREFKRKTGKTIREFFNQERMQKAAWLLAHTSWSVHQIALEVGFSYPAHFANTFKNCYNVSATEYRRGSRDGRLS